MTLIIGQFAQQSMEKRPRFNRNGIFRHFPPWIQVWWQRCEAAGAGGGEKNWEDSAVLLMTGQPIPPMYVFSEIKVERLTSQWLVLSWKSGWPDIQEFDQERILFPKLLDVIIIQSKQSWGYELWKSSRESHGWIRHFQRHLTRLRVIFPGESLCRF